MLFVVNDPGREAPLKEVTDAVVAVVEPLRVEEAEPVHRARKDSAGRRDDEVRVVRHQAPVEQLPAEAAGRFLELRDERVGVVAVAHDRLARNTAHRDVKHASFGQEHGSRRAGHPPRLVGRHAPFCHDTVSTWRTPEGQSLGVDAAAAFPRPVRVGQTLHDA